MVYLINSHFRAELNVGNDQPIPRLEHLLKNNQDKDSLIDKRLDLNDNDLRDAIIRDDIDFNVRNQKNISARQHNSNQEINELDHAR